MKKHLKKLFKELNGMPTDRTDKIVIGIFLITLFTLIILLSSL